MATHPHVSDPSRERRWRRVAWLAVKWVLTVAVVVVVGRQAWHLWNQDDIQRVEWHVGWLVLAGIVYALGWLPSVWFWRRLLHAFGGEVRYADAARAYYCGHLGKYIPGKATVLVIRAGLIKDRGARLGAAALAATYETLLVMAVGAALAFACTPFLLSDKLLAALPQSQAIESITEMLRRLTHQTPYLPALIVLVIAGCGLPLMSRLLSLLSTKFMPAELKASGQQVRIDTKLVAAGAGTFVIGWLAHGLSLGLTLRGVSPGPFDLADWPLWTGGISLASVSGFVVLFAPGGIGVREGLLIGVLGNQPGIGPQQAVAAAVLLRFVWLATEIVVAVALYYMVRVPELPVPHEQRVA